jgi:hypothetical protein
MTFRRSSKKYTEWIKKGKVSMNNALSIFEDKEAYSLTLLNQKPYGKAGRINY